MHSHMCIRCHVFGNQHPFLIKHGKCPHSSCQFSTILLIYIHVYVNNNIGYEQMKKDVLSNQRLMSLVKFRAFKNGL